MWTLKPPASKPPDAPPEGLEQYRQKRDPTQTTEPFGAERKRSASVTSAGRFVVHLHQARQTHFDLRLQVGSTLKSFAVPRGPSLDPTLRHLAIHTEDHPLEYADFEDVIPAGNYGAGPMIAWDLGRVQYLDTSAEAGLAAGKLDFVLSGHKLRGRFGLVRTKRGEGKEWLLLKKRDAFAREGSDIVSEAPWSVLSGLQVDELSERAAIAAALEADAAERGAPERALDVTRVEPMLCALDGAQLDEADRLYELKLDGVRILADRRGKHVTLRYRNGRVCTASYPEIARAVETLPGERLVLDGEIVAFDEKGRPRFQRLGPRIHARRALDIAHAVGETPVVYLVFDLLTVGQRDLVGLPLLERKRLLSRLIRGKGLVRALDHIQGRGGELFALCKHEGLEGVVAKRSRSPYRFGPFRGDDWVKIKCERDHDFVIVGFLPGKGSRGPLGAVAVGSYHGERLLYRGRVGSGFDQATLRDLLPRLQELERPEPPLGEPAPEDARGARWVEPKLVASVTYAGFSDDGRLRHPVFHGLRSDVAPEACNAHPPGLDLDPEPTVEAASPEPAPHQLGSGVVLTNRDKVFWPEDGYTKGDLLDYYEAVAPVILPFLAERPVVLVRHPDGIQGKSFFQWNVPAGTPDFIRKLTLRDSEEPSHEKTVFLIDDVQSLLYVVNLGSIPFHVLACRASSRDFCDFLTFDLDLGERTFAHAIRIALSLREILDEVGLVGYPKTSGQGGLHVLVPLGPGVPFEAAKLLVELLGRLVTARHREDATMERRVDRRGGRLYVDTGQTGTSRTIVAPYSVRAHPGATVSTPLFWNELSGALDPARFTIMTLPARIAELGDPLKGLLEERPDIPGALSKLEPRVRA